ncbi:MAG: P-loop NTPase [Spirochaetales bacterium]|nr:P-loop NTPase [Spirochaetales bacterium]
MHLPILTYMSTILPVASGKGGTGKTVLSGNLGVALARKGKKTILIDLDLGGANLHTCLGIRNDRPGIGDYIYKHVQSLSEIIYNTPVQNLFFIPGDVLLPGTANLDYGTKKKIIRNIQNLDADYIILDLGSGTSFNIIDFFLISPAGIIVTTTETTAILNAYSFLKTVIFRMLYRSFPSKSEERKMIYSFITNRIEGKSISFHDLINTILYINPGSGTTAMETFKKIFPKMVINMGTSNSDIEIGGKLKIIVRQNLGLKIHYIGYLPRSKEITLSIIQRQPVYMLSPGSLFSKSINNLAEKVISDGLIPPPVLYESDEDLEELREQINLK